MASFPSTLLAPLLILLTFVHLPLQAHSESGFSVELIHRNSPKSPLYDPSSTTSSRIKSAALRSHARALYFRQAMQTPTRSSGATPAKGENLYSEIMRTDFEYLMSFYLGSSDEKIFAIADTGSDLTWIQCKPCYNCTPKTTPLFDPQASSTYKVVSCDTDSCLALPLRGCSSKLQCEYNYVYGDGSFVDGFLSTETIKFDTIKGRRVQFPEILFGCTHSIKGNFVNTSAGLVGLGGGKLSLIRQLGSTIESKFSYCLPSSNHNSTMSHINFGSTAIISEPNAVTTPLIHSPFDTFYFLKLEQISVDGQGTVEMKPTTTASTGTVRGNMIIDSGTTLTFIDNETLQSVIQMVKSSVKLPKVKDPNEAFRLCFDVSRAKKDVGFPKIKFHFFGGAVITLNQSNVFVESAKNIMCLALVSVDGMALNIFGNIAQQNFHIGYDLEAMKLTLAPADCAKL